MTSSAFAEGAMTVFAVVELVVIILGIYWAVTTHRRVNTLEREVSWLKGRTAAPDAPRITDRAPSGVYDLGGGATTAQRPPRRP